MGVLIGNVSQAVPRDDFGIPVTAPTFEDTSGLAPQWQGYLYEAVAGSTSLFDEEVTVEKRLRGGWYDVLDSNAVICDYV